MRRNDCIDASCPRFPVRDLRSAARTITRAPRLAHFTSALQNRRSRVPSQTAQQAQSIAPLCNNCRTKYMLTNNVDYHDLGAHDFTRRNLDVSYSRSPAGKHPRLHRPVRPIPQTHTTKLSPSLTVHFRVRLAAFGSADPDVPPGLPARRRRRPRPRLPHAATRPAERRRPGSPPHSAPPAKDQDASGPT